jgi:predicted transglutaminase-like cysteine proteinase
MDKELEMEHPEECKGKAHYWVLDAKNLGTCKRCGAKKQFNVQESGWQRRQIVVVKN